MPATFTSFTVKDNPKKKRPEAVMKISLQKAEWPAFPLIASAMFICVCLTRPLLPIDETRYMSVAWEMWLNHGWLKPLTMNFEPYNHKPPVLFWMINAFWSVFGVSRWAATMPIVLVSFANLYLAGKIYGTLFPQEKRERAIWVMLGSFPFLMYSTLVMFDMTMCFFTQLSCLCLLNFAKDGRWRWTCCLGLCLGLGVLTKGPVAYLYIAFIILFGPLWTKGRITALRWYEGFLGALLISVPIVLLWLVPVLQSSDGDFAASLIWHQTVDRISGRSANHGAGSIQVHDRPFYFYAMILPALFLPWAFLPKFWKGVREIPFTAEMKFLFFWFVPTFAVFSLIGGKQAHYLIPIFPAAVMASAYAMRNIAQKTIVRTSFLMIFLFLAVHIGAGLTVFKYYDTTPVAELLARYQGRDIAFVHNYHAELGFEGRLTRKIEDVPRGAVAAWMRAHPGGILVVRYDNPAETKGLRSLADYPFRGERIGIFEKAGEP